MKNYCGKCERYELCQNLCATCEEYVNQDFVPIEEGLIDINIENREQEIDYDDLDPFDDTISKRIFKSRYKYAVILLHEDGKSADEIAYHVPISISQIYRIIQNYKK